MGYYTSFDLQVIIGDSYNNAGDSVIIEDLLNCSENAEYAIDIYGNSTNATKWYDHEKQLRKISKKYPEALLLLDGEGEESGDIWKEYYQNGKMQLCDVKLTFDEFDKTKLD